MPGGPLKPGAIYNSNRFTLRALIQALGCECTDLGIVPDQLVATRDALRHAAQAHDVIVTSGGVSVGEEDHLKPAVQAEGTLELWQIAIKPGKPLAFGSVRRAEPKTGSAWFVGLPGNPVSSFIISWGAALVAEAAGGRCCRRRRWPCVRFRLARGDKRASSCAFAQCAWSRLFSHRVGESERKRMNLENVRSRNVVDNWGSSRLRTLDLIFLISEKRGQARLLTEMISV